ncbi:NADP-dependent oxidoreductase [Paraburkholderia aspalathi]|uniref:Enoyl reductase (ER) domain-containing protein n=1 Tax=Paraburkholderia aspalathi TaxID=1324617 RepID=A0A1I7E9G1_9BURK|nr:NADP-dependent oxidoreductase [Paraburkholderia aspalathi]SFU20577.1 hypothetical protein SAMN05192563_101559 [Paraburkholderia aspalathi]
MQHNSQAQRIVLAARPEGEPKATDFRLEKMSIPGPALGQVLLQTLWLSLDPYMRGMMDDVESYVEPVALNQTMAGEVIARVLASRLDGYSPGDVVLAPIGWTTHGLSDGTRLRKIAPSTIPLEAHLGVLGMPGFTAYAGMAEIGKPKRGETVVVASASGPVGSLVGQIARRAGAKVVGIAGGAEKCSYVKEVFGFDVVIDHRKGNLGQALSDACPNGIDVYFENVGGPVWDAVFPLLNRFARVPVCGLIADYNGISGEDTITARDIMLMTLVKSYTIRGYINYDLEHLLPAFLADIAPGVEDGSIAHREQIVQGLENAPAALNGLLKGANFGKLVVKVAE